MLHTHACTEGLLPTKKRPTDMVLIAMMFVLIAMVVWAMRTTSPPALAPFSIPVVQGSGSGSTAANRTEDLSDFEQRTQALVSSDSPKAFQTLLASLKQREPLPQRRIVMTALQSASPAVVPVLMTALSDAAPGVRAGAAEVLGLRREYQAIAVLTEATRDPIASVRLEAVKSLGALDAWQVLPRLEQLQVNEPNYGVRQAAIATKEAFQGHMAQEIGVSTSQLRDVSVTGGGLHTFAVTSSDLYARHGTRGSW